MVELSLYEPISINRKSNSFCSACVQTPGYDINKCCYFSDNNLPVGAVIPLITVTENKEFASKSCSTDYLKLEAASRFKNATMTELIIQILNSLARSKNTANGFRFRKNQFTVATSRFQTY